MSGDTDIIELLTPDERARLDVISYRILSDMLAGVQREGHVSQADLIQGSMKLTVQAAPNAAGLPVLLSGTGRMPETDLTDPETDNHAQVVLHLYRQTDEAVEAAIFDAVRQGRLL